MAQRTRLPSRAEANAGLAKQHFLYLDANKDGFIDLTEFKAYFQARMAQMQSDRSQAGGGRTILPGAVPDHAAAARRAARGSGGA